MLASRAVRFVAVALSALWAGQALAAAPVLVIDVDSGKVLYADHATDPWYPASITKLMTTYVALSAVRDGRISLDTPLTISELAHSMPPSKMGFPPGTEVTLDNALKIIMVKSANDIAMAIAEGVGGSVDNFADMMNAAAQRLGMHESHFVNPHGLPDERQQTSARDMATVGRALLREFPEYAWYFNIGAIKFGRRIMRNHNGLIGRYAGADGMKTGFICAGGFNVVASATRNGRRLITVVMGSRTANARTIKAASLFDQGFATWGFGAPTLDQLPASAMASPPDMRPYVCQRRGPAPAEEDAQPALASAQGDNGRVQLGPRAYFEPIVVWTGRTPPSAVAAKESEKQPAKPAEAKLKPKPVRAAKTARPSAAAKAFAATEPKSIINEGGASKTAIQPDAALKPKGAASGEAPRKMNGAAAKPKPPQTAAISLPASLRPSDAGEKPPVNAKLTAAPKGKPPQKHLASPGEKKPRVANRPKPKQASAAQHKSE
jgi:D-alanyl-D-alanine carboxypeptidase